MNALCDIAITNRDPRWCGEMARVETDEDPHAALLRYQAANFMRLAAVFIASHSVEFDALSRRMYAQESRT